MTSELISKICKQSKTFLSRRLFIVFILCTFLFYFQNMKICRENILSIHTRLHTSRVYCFKKQILVFLKRISFEALNFCSVFSPTHSSQKLIEKKEQNVQLLILAPTYMYFIKCDNNKNVIYICTNGRFQRNVFLVRHIFFMSCKEKLLFLSIYFHKEQQIILLFISLFAGRHLIKSPTNNILDAMNNKGS